MIPFIDLSVSYHQVDEEVRHAIGEVIARNSYILGPAVAQFEEAMARYHGVAHAVGVASGTDAILLSLQAAGIGKGDEVITTPFTFVATAEVILRAGAVPVFADIDAEGLNIDPDDVEAKVTDRTRAILPVHLYGLPADMEALGRTARKYGLKVIEDCAQSTGARIGEKMTGSFGDASAFSFFPTKNLGGMGDGGMVLTDSEEVARSLRMLRDHGSTRRDFYELTGYNSRLDALQAAVLKVKLEKLEEWNGQRRANAVLYRELLDGVEGLRLPPEGPEMHHVYNQFTVQTPRRDDLRAHLTAKEIGSMVYYSRSLHLQPVFSHLPCRPGDFPVSERAQNEVLSLPVYPGLSEEDLRTVAGAVREFFGR